jgi:hypothetical protein
VAWTVEAILSLAPDASSAKAGRDLATLRKWVSLGRREDALWGECQGSGAQPYRTGVDLSGPAFKCSCPSRKFPCKHGLGLFLVFADEPAAVPSAEAPGWLADWLKGRRARSDQAAVPTETPAADPARAAAEQQKRAQRREARVGAGVEELERWLHDLVRPGLADIPARPRASFEQMAARLTDTQAPGLARLVRDLADIPHASERWPERMLLELGRLALLLEAYRRQDSLPAGLRAEVRTLVGFAEAREQVLAAPAVEDTWSVLGRRGEVEEKLRVQRTWLWGEETQRWALSIDFAAPGQVLERPLAPGTRARGALCFYPGSMPLRALVQGRLETLGPLGSMPSVAVEPALRGYAEALGRNPWLERFPLALGPVVPEEDSAAAWRAVDEARRSLPLGGRAGWHLLALSGGHPLELFGEWDGHRLWPLAARANGSFVHLAAQSGEAESAA